MLAHGKRVSSIRMPTTLPGKALVCEGATGSSTGGPVRLFDLGTGRSVIETKDNLASTGCAYSNLLVTYHSNTFFFYDMCTRPFFLL